MSFDTDRDFRKSLEKSSNPYNDIRKIAAQARALANDYDNEVAHSQALTHVLHGTKPTMKEQYHSEREAEIIRDFFCSIDDKEICDAVYDSYYEGKTKRNLVYVYNNISDESQKARVRILVKMLLRKMK